MFKKQIPATLGILIIVLLAGGVVGATFFLYDVEEDIVAEKEEEDKPILEESFNIIQEAAESVIIEEADGHREYKGITLGRDIDISDSSIRLSLQHNYSAPGFYNIKGNVGNVFLDKEEEIKKLSLHQINELKNEKVLSVRIVVRKEIGFSERIKNFFISPALGRDWFIIEEIKNPEKIIFKKPGKKKLGVTGKIAGDSVGIYWTFIPDENQGLHVQKRIRNEEDQFIAKVTRPSTHLIKFKNNPEYFKIPADNFHQNSSPDLVEKVIVEGEENCPDFDMSCLVDAETVKTEVILFLENDRIFKPTTENGTISYVFCPAGSSETCYFSIEESSRKKSTIYITHSTKIINGDLQDIRKGQRIEVRGNIECSKLSDILVGEAMEDTFIKCNFFAGEIEFE